MSRHFGPRTSLFLAVIAAASVAAAGQTPASPPPGEVTSERPPAIAPSVRPGAIEVARRAVTGDSADAGRWKGARSVKVSTGLAEVRLADGASLRLSVGDVVGTDTVERIEPGRILLARRGAEGAATGPKLATVLVTFDAAGVGRTRVYWLQDSKAVVPPIVK